MPRRASVQTTARGTIYLLHFAEKTARNHQHYLGFTRDFRRRFSEHSSGRGAVETRIAWSEGLTMRVAATWQGSEVLETRIKLWMRAGRRSYACFCPYCGGDPAEMPEFLQAALGPPTTRIRIDPGTLIHSQTVRPY